VVVEWIIITYSITYGQFGWALVAVFGYGNSSAGGVVVTGSNPVVPTKYKKAAS